MEIEIRRARPEDAENINRVMHAAWLVTYPNAAAGITTDDIEDSFKDMFTEERIAESQERLRLIPENEQRSVAVVDGKVVGVSRIIREENTNHLQTMYVHPDYQGKGIGTALWKDIQVFLDSNMDTVLEVAIYNEQAINFYKKLGFEDTGERFSNEKYRMRSGAVVPEMRMILKARM